MSALIVTELKDRVLTIRMNRPEKKNALTQEMYSALAEAVNQAAADPKVRVLLLTGNGDAFTSGNDIQDFLNVPVGAKLNDTAVGSFMYALAGFPKPVVAAVNGLAIGIGFTMLLHCDLVYAAAGAKLQAPFTNLGICPEFASTYVVPRMMGHQRAAELMLLGEPFSAETAREFGVVNAVVPKEQLLAHAEERARKLAELPPKGMRITKQLMRRWSNEVVLEAAAVEGDHFIPMLRQPEAQEVMSAFMQKRKPDFSKFE